MSRASRAVLFVAGAGLVVAWLAAAADRQPVAPATRQNDDGAALARAEHLAQNIQSQSARLRAHLASAPEPAPSGRNPFSFQSRTVSAPRHDRVRAATLGSVLSMPVPDPPPIALSGIAEDAPAAGNSATPVRTAVLSGYGDVFLVKVGDIVASRYRVTAVGADAVEIADLITGRTIRLGLR
jgi:hypothetical protein